MADATPVALDLRDHVAFERDRPVVLSVADAAALGLAVICLEPGQTLDARLAPEDVLLTVIGGRAWVVVDDAEVVLEPLQAVLVPSGAAYGIRNDSPDPLILQRVAARPRGHDVGAGDDGEAGAHAGGTARPPRPEPGPTVPDEQPAPEPSGRLTRLRRLLGSG